MITFGFSMYKFFSNKLEKYDSGASAIRPREFGIALILTELTILATGRIEHQRDLRQLAKHYPGMPVSGTRIVQALVAVLGALALRI